MSRRDEQSEPPRAQSEPIPRPAGSGSAMDRIACLLRREVCDVEIDPWFRLGFRLGLRRACLFVIAHQKLARPEDVERLLVEGAFGSLPTINLQGQGTQRRSRRKILAARLGLEQKRRGQHEHSRNPEAERPGIHADFASGPLFEMQRSEITRCTANNMISATTKISHPSKPWKNPSALSGSQYCTSSPVPKMRQLLAATAIGTAEHASVIRTQIRVSVRYP